MPAHLVDKLVRSLPSPARGNTITYDDEIQGFGIRITAGGARSFILNYRVAGRERRLTIGGFPAWSTAAARDEARELRRRVDRGEDPLAQRIEARQAPTVRDLWLEYEAKHLPTKRARSGADDRSMWQAYILPKFGPAKVSAITAADVDELHAEISATKPMRANRVVEVLRKAMNLAIRWGWRGDNPCTGTRKNTEHKRERYLTAGEVSRLLQALSEHQEQISCDAIRLLLLTGARKSEVLGAQWTMFDLEAGIWTKPAATTKQNKLHRVPLSDDALILLRRIKERSDDATYVFPGHAKAAGERRPEPPSRPLRDIKRTWASVCKTAQVPDARIHDLRHTFASVTISQKHPLPVVGALLGHTQASTTMRYVHLYDEPLRAAANDAGTRINGNK